MSLIENFRIDSFKSDRQRELCNVTISRGFLVDSLETIEQLFNSDESALTPEQLQKYLEAADYAKSFGRNDKGMIRRVQEHLSRLPY